MRRNIITLAGIFGALAVIFGAFGAHALKGLLSTTQLETYQTGVAYHFYHALALLAIGFHLQKNQAKTLVYAAYAFIGGILLFSGSLYLLSCREVLGIETWAFLGPITPFGGTLFIVGWGLLVRFGWKTNEA